MKYFFLLVLILMIKISYAQSCTDSDFNGIEPYQDKSYVKTHWDNKKYPISSSFYTQGTTTGEGSTGSVSSFVDSCEGNTLKEFYCGDVYFSSIGNVKRVLEVGINCVGGCSNGACLKPTCSQWGVNSCTNAEECLGQDNQGNSYILPSSEGLCCVGTCTLKQGKCNSDLSCNDNNACTNDKCESNSCTHTSIESCQNSVFPKSCANSVSEGILKNSYTISEITNLGIKVKETLKRSTGNEFDLKKDKILLSNGKLITITNVIRTENTFMLSKDDLDLQTIGTTTDDKICIYTINEKKVTCSVLNGFICKDSEICNGKLIEFATDTNKCCDKICELQKSENIVDDVEKQLNPNPTTNENEEDLNKIVEEEQNEKAGFFEKIFIWFINLF